MKYFILISFIILFLKRVNYFRARKMYKRRQINIYDWMKMGSKNRKELDHSEQIKVMEHKKELLSKIRREYSNYKKSLIK